MVLRGHDHAIVRPTETRRREADLEGGPKVGTSAEAIDQTVESHVIEVSTLHEVFMRCCCRNVSAGKH
jgi:hypothetical protein